jgi:SAM-dependent methyltransferase
MGGTSMAVKRWAADPLYRSIIRGDVLEIGPGHEPLSRYDFPLATSFTCIDHRLQPETYGATWIEGDATDTGKLGDRTFDTVYSSHCLEHVVNPTLALMQWWDVLRPGGHLIVIVPSWAHYERLIWPPHINSDHRAAWVLHIQGARLSWIRGLVNEVVALPDATLQRALTLDAGFDPQTREDQTASGTCECGLEVVARKAGA